MMPGFINTLLKKGGGGRNEIVRDFKIEPVAHTCHLTITPTSGQPGLRSEPLSINQQNARSWAQGCTPVILALEGWRLKAQFFNVSRGYTVKCKTILDSKRNRVLRPEPQRAPEAAPHAAHLHALRLVDALLVAADVESVLHVEQLVYLSRAARDRARSRRSHFTTPLTGLLPGRHVGRKQGPAARNYGKRSSTGPIGGVERKTLQSLLRTIVRIPSTNTRASGPKH